MNQSEIETACESVREVLDTKIDRSNGDELTGKLDALTNIQGLAAETMSQAERAYNRKAGIILEQLRNLKAGEQKLKLNSLAADEIYYLRLAEQYSSEIHYQQKALITEISYLKGERFNSNR